MLLRPNIPLIICSASHSSLYISSSVQLLRRPGFYQWPQLSTSLVRIPERASPPEFWPRSYLKSKCMYAAPQTPRLLPHGNQFEVCFGLVYTCPIHTLAFIRELPLSPNSSFPRGPLMPKSLHSDSRVGKDIYSLEHMRFKAKCCLIKEIKTWCLKRVLIT